MKYQILIILIAFLSTNLLAQKSEEEYRSLVLDQSSEIIKLEKDLSYYYFTASNNFLAWYEGYTNQVYYKNLDNGKVSRLVFLDGRGPFEIKSLRGLSIIKSKLLVLDSQNQKILQFDLEQQRFVSEFLIGKNRIQYITSSAEKLYGKGINRNGIYFEINPSTEQIVSIINSFNEDFAREMNKNIFRFEGPFLANSEYLISVRTYEPSLYTFDLNGKLNDFEYDEVKSKPEYEFNNFGIATRPPSQVNMVIKDAALKPNSNIVYLAREGYTEKYPENNRTVLYEYDYVKREYVGVFETGVESIGKIATNNTHLFVYDDENFTITKIKL